MRTGSPGKTNAVRRLRNRTNLGNISLAASTANTLWWMSLWKDALAFQSARRDVPGTQSRLLMRLLHENSDTEFGKRWEFASIRSVDGYRDRVPLSTYDDYQSDVSRIMTGAQRVLTRDPVILLEPTSGSTGPTKLIPYTGSLKAEFLRAIAPWVVDVFRHEPGVIKGQAYWSISPIAQPGDVAESIVPIGFEDDSEYLGALGRMFVRSTMAVPSAVRHLADIDTFRYVTLFFLLRSRNLSLISVWHPSFLTLLLGPLMKWGDRLADDVADGTIRPPGPGRTGLPDNLPSSLRPDPERADLIRETIHFGAEGEGVGSRLWPGLRLISCWADGNAGPYLPDLQYDFPGVVIQPKGLVSTEAIVSIPVRGHSGCMLALRSHFFEFVHRSQDRHQGTFLAHELSPGELYSVVVTTGGGLYRYQTGDLVEIVGYAGTCPLLKFVGKESHTSDRFGEKLNERNVQEALESGIAENGLSPHFVMVAFDEAIDNPGYVLFVESNSDSDQGLMSLGNSMEAALRLNYHYRYCRDLGQLGPLTVFRIQAGAYETYARISQANGQSIGGLKLAALHNFASWSRSFSGRFLESTSVDGDPFH